MKQNDSSTHPELERSQISQSISYSCQAEQQISDIFLINPVYIICLLQICMPSCLLSRLRQHQCMWSWQDQVTRCNSNTRIQNDKALFRRYLVPLAWKEFRRQGVLLCYILQPLTESQVRLRKEGQIPGEAVHSVPINCLVNCSVQSWNMVAASEDTLEN